MTIAYPTIPGVTFKTIERFPGYVFGSNGSCWSLWDRNAGNGRPPKMGTDWREMRPTQSGPSYMFFTIRSDKDRCRKNYLVHRLILEAFIGPCPPGEQGCHGNGDPTDNRIENLRWDTPKNNTGDKWRHGTMRIGTQSHFAKTEPCAVREMRRLYGQGVSTRDLATQFRMSRANIQRICNREIWQHVV